MAPRYKVTLTEEERRRLEALTRESERQRPPSLSMPALCCCVMPDQHGSPWKVAEVAEALGVSARTIEHLKASFVEEGIEAALERKPSAKPP